MKKYKIMALTMMHVAVLGIERQTLSPKPYTYAKPVGPQLFGEPNKKASSSRLMQKQERERLVQKFEAMTRGGKVAFEEAQKIVDMLKSNPDPESRSEGLRLEKHLMTLRTYNMCHEKVKQTRAQNEQLKKQLAEAQKEVSRGGASASSIHKVTELEQKVVEVQKKEQEQTELIIDMTKNAPELPKLTLLKKRAEIEFGKHAVKKMSANKELTREDLVKDPKSHVIQLLGLHFNQDSGRLEARKTEGGEETTPEWELAQATMLIAQLMQDNEAYKKEITEFKQKTNEVEKPGESLREEKAEGEELKRLMAENKELKKKLKGLPEEAAVISRAEQAEPQGATEKIVALEKELENAKAEIGELAKLKDAAHAILRDCFGDGFADAVTLGVNSNLLLDAIDYKKTFVQDLCSAIQQREKEADKATANYFGF